MADGDITKGLVARIRDLLDDHAKRLIPNDVIIYHKLNYYQDEFMTFYLTTTQDWTVAMTSATEYDLQKAEGDDVVGERFKLISQWVADTEETDLTGIGMRVDYRANKIYIEEPESGVTIYMRGYIKPSSTDEISATVDPIIGEEYYKYLVEAVLSEYSTKDRPQKPIEWVYSRVRKTAEKLRDTNRFSVKTGNPFGEFNF